MGLTRGNKFEDPVRQDVRGKRGCERKRKGNGHDSEVKKRERKGRGDWAFTNGLVH